MADAAHLQLRGGRKLVGDLTRRVTHCVPVTDPPRKQLSPLARVVTVAMWMAAVALLALGLIETCGR